MMKLVIYRTDGEISNVHRVPAEFENEDLAERVASFNANNACINQVADVVTIQAGSVIDFLLSLKESEPEKRRRDIRHILSEFESIQDALADLEQSVRKELADDDY